MKTSTDPNFLIIEAYTHKINVKKIKIKTIFLNKLPFNRLSLVESSSASLDLGPGSMYPAANSSLENSSNSSFVAKVLMLPGFHLTSNVIIKSLKKI